MKWPIFFIIFGCANFSEYRFSFEDFSVQRTEYSLVDRSGSFSMIRELGPKKKTSEFVCKEQVFAGVGRNREEVQRNIAISTFEKFDRNLSVLFPKISQYTVWLEGKRYVSEIKVDHKLRKVFLKTSAPEQEDTKTKTFNFPKGKDVKSFCFFSQITECALASSFLKLAIEKRRGEMGILIVWDGYPFFQEQYTDLPNEIITASTLEYDGRLQTGEWRFSLDLGEQTIFFLVDDNGNLLKKFWVSQGMSMVKKGLQELPEEQEE